MTDILEYQQANYDLRLENERLNNQIGNLMNKINNMQNNQTGLLQQNELLKNVISEMQSGIEHQRQLMARDASALARRTSMRSGRFHSIVQMELK